MTILKNNPTTLGYLFEDLFDQFPGNWNKEGKSQFASVAVNIHETTDAYHLELNAPGRKKEDFKINVENGLLTISFEKKTEAEVKEYKTIRKEFQVQSFKRSFSLDEKINTGAIQARYEEGVLKIHLPKKEQIQVVPQQIAVN